MPPNSPHIWIATSLKALAAAAVATLLLTSHVEAAGLGKLTVLSSRGQPLHAEIELTSVSHDEAAGLVAKLASEKNYQQTDIFFNPVLLSLKFSIEQSGDRHFVLVTSAKSMDESFVDILMELSGAGSPLVREYTVVLDPAEKRQAQPATLASPVANAVPVTSSPPGPGETSPPALITMAEPPQAATAASAVPPGNSTMHELEQLMQSHEVSELRTSYNGNYGSSLLFKTDSRAYYVALFQNKKFWRVVKTTSDTQAEQIYKNFVAQTENLAAIDIHLVQLEAEKQYTEQQIATQEARLSVLKNDLLLQKQQEKNVSTQQELARQQTQALSSQQQAARRELQTLKNRVRTLESQQTTMDDSNLSDGKASKK